MSVRFILWSGLIAPCLLAGCLQPGEEAAAATEDAIRGGLPADRHPEAVIIDGQHRDGSPLACSGALIAPRVVLTAGRCVRDVGTWDVRAPLAGGMAAYGRGAEWIDVGSGQGGQQGGSAGGLGLIYLDRPIWLRGYPTLATWPLQEGASVVTVGRTSDGQTSYSTMYESAPVPVVDATSHGYAGHYASRDVTDDADDGGPVYAAGSNTIVAVSNGFGEGASLLARVDGAAGWIRQRIATYGSGQGGYPGGNPWPGNPGGNPWPGNPGGGGREWPGNPGGGGREWPGNPGGHEGGGGRGWPGNPGGHEGGGGQPGQPGQPGEGGHHEGGGEHRRP
jgi:hypothetical protein